ncbi:hypothetical protein [Halostella litorea]|uniref:hypothetical protein n=1 Tax=Halostella litorea TaxID=2528831 RepID=UPI0010929719|nr:hypothetical protein [Halostella litorea]
MTRPTPDDLEAAHEAVVERWRAERPRDLWRLQDAAEQDILDASYWPEDWRDHDLESEFYGEIVGRASAR